MTFSLVGRDAATGMFGTVVASSSPCVAARCAHARAGAGAVASQNVTDPSLGSRLLAGTLSDSALQDIRDRDGVSAAQAQADYLEALAALPRLEPVPERVLAHIEIHIAQRRELRELGIVTRVAAPRRLRIALTGEGGHAGEISMELRRDALAAAAELVLAIEAAAQAEPPQTVGTAADLTVSPGAVSVIPQRAVLAVDLRALEPASLDRLEARIRARAAEIGERRDVEVKVELLRGGEPVVLDEALTRDALAAAQRLGIPARETWSGAGHDAQHLAALMPALLLFVPLHGGQSHSPAEGADEAEILAATRLAAEVLRARHS